MSHSYQSLLQLLSDTYHLHQKTTYIHWNVNGHHFFSLHKALEEQYNELHTAVDDIAERIKAIDPSLEAHVNTQPSFGPAHLASAHDLIDDLIESHICVTQTLKKLIEESSEHDPVTEDMAIERLASHEKTLWMLQAFNAQTC